MKQQKMKTGQLVLSNIPNFLTISRVLITFIVMYLIFTGEKMTKIIAIFVIGALTDFFDGQLARRFNWVSEFGRRADMIADRFLWAGTSIAFIVAYGIQGQIGWIEGMQFFLLLTREIISLPFAFYAFFSGNPLPQARYVAKVTTFIQGFALPSIILSVYYPNWTYLSIPLSIACTITGFKSALYYIYDTQKNDVGKKKRA